MFLPVSLLLYYLTPQKLRNGVLLLLSLLFYSWGEVRYFPIMLASIIIDFTASNCIEKNRNCRYKMRFWLLVSVVFNLGMLGFFKYIGFFTSNFNSLFNLNIPVITLTLPLGISFYTFQTMSYTIDVYREKVKAETSLIDFGAFVALFPQLIAGPIVRYTEINRELKNRVISASQVSSGVKTFILGLGSKVLIANNVGSLWSETEMLGFESISSPLAWIALLAFTIQIYFDFSGYSLMAIGLGRMLGFEFPKNFDFPYISRSITEFWRRWHMTLGSWFREYLYFPLGGSRLGKRRTYQNLFIVWAATGLWHGASWNFVLWGLYYCLLLILEKAFLMPYLQKGKGWPHLYTMFLVMVSWAIFAVTDFPEMASLLKKLFVFMPGNDWKYYFRNYAGSFISALILATPLLKKPLARLEKSNILTLLLYGSVFMISVAYLVDSTYNPFLYFRF